MLRHMASDLALQARIHPQEPPEVCGHIGCGWAAGETEAQWTAGSPIHPARRPCLCPFPFELQKWLKMAIFGHF